MRGLVRARWVVGAAVLALVATACGSSGEEGGGSGGTQGGGAFSFYIGEPEHLIPGNTNESNGGEVLDALYTGLINYDPQTSQPVYNGIAEENGITSDDQKTWTIKLKKGWTFHNGEPVTAQSFVDAWNFTAYAPNANGNSYFFENVQGFDDLQTEKEGEEPKAEKMSGLEAVNDHTLKVTLKAPFSQFPLSLGYTAFYPMAKACLDDLKACEEKPIGSGPFKMDGTWQHNQAINVTKFADYAGAAPKSDAVEFRIYTDVNTAYNDLLAGSLDVMDTLPPEKVNDAKAKMADRFIERESSNFTYIGFPLYDDRFKNADLRRAFSMAIDRQSIVDQIFNGAYTPAKSVVSPVVAGSRANPCGDSCEYDPEGAKKLLEKAGGFDGRLELWFNAGSGHDQWMQAVANNLRQNLGIKSVVFKQKQFAEYLADLDADKATGPFRLGWIMDYPSPQNYLEPIYGTGGSSNASEYSNAQVDQLIEKGNSAPTIEAGIEYYNQAEDLILQDMPVIPMFHQKVQAAYSDNVDNVVIDAFTSTDIENITVNR
ncbi:MAG: peptide ABC transporter substrate-binding protein [Actinomycetes bacterium]